jgi:hypothetical protein
MAQDDAASEAWMHGAHSAANQQASDRSQAAHSSTGLSDAKPPAPSCAAPRHFSDAAVKYLEHFQCEDRCGAAQTKAPGMLTTHAKNTGSLELHYDTRQLASNSFEVTVTLCLEARIDVVATGIGTGPKLAKKQAALNLLRAEAVAAGV